MVFILSQEKPIKEKLKRDFLPELRNITKELEDAIIEKNSEEEKKITLKLEVLLRKINKALFV